MLLDDGRETIGTSALDASPDVILRMPGDSLAPLLLSVALAAVFVGMLIHSWWLFGVATSCSVSATVAWLWPEAKLGQTMDIVSGHG
jgi:cytochrome c oxidase subunit 1/cytochrome c oxidase subunit I+III